MPHTLDPDCRARVWRKVGEELNFEARGLANVFNQDAVGAVSDVAGKGRSRTDSKLDSAPDSAVETGEGEGSGSGNGNGKVRSRKRWSLKGFQ